MSAENEPELSDSEWLLRRIVPRGRDKANDAVKAISFTLRVTQAETELSLYVEAGCDTKLLLSRAPVGFGLARVLVGDLRAAGFVVRPDRDHIDEEIGHLHVSAEPPTIDSDGQISLDLRERLASAAQWVVRPGETVL